MEFPKYVTLNGGSAVRLVEISEIANTAKYYRDAGHWDVWITLRDDKLICENNKGPMKHINGTEAKECSKADWSEDNGGHPHPLND